MKIEIITLIVFLIITISIIVLTIFAVINRKSCNQNNENKMSYKDINALEFDELIKKSGVEIIDVRTEEEYKAGHIAGAKLIPINSFDKTLDKNPLSQDKKILVYCQSGSRSRIAAASVVAKGYKEVYNLKNGIMEWEEANLPIEK